MKRLIAPLMVYLSEIGLYVRSQAHNFLVFCSSLNIHSKDTWTKTQIPPHCICHYALLIAIHLLVEDIKLGGIIGAYIG